MCSSIKVKHAETGPFLLLQVVFSVLTALLAAKRLPNRSTVAVKIMEKNTFATSAYIDAPYCDVIKYLMDLQKLNDWTLFSRMHKRVDDYTWIGTASGYQHDLYYHVRQIDAGDVSGIEWHCGYSEGEYHQIYPVFVFKPDYIESKNDESGVYLHWVSFLDPARTTQMIRDGVDVVHNSECRSLKARLEQNAGRDCAGIGRYAVDSTTIYIDADYDMVVDYVSDARNMAQWGHLFRAGKDVDVERGLFVDEYGRDVAVENRLIRLPKYAIVDHRVRYPERHFVQCSPMVIIPCSYALGNQSARGCFLHRIMFWTAAGEQTMGRLLSDDFSAESINMKRFLEAMAGNKETFAKGPSYVPKD